MAPKVQIDLDPEDGGMFDYYFYQLELMHTLNHCLSRLGYPGFVIKVRPSHPVLPAIPLLQHLTPAPLTRVTHPAGSSEAGARAPAPAADRAHQLQALPGRTGAQACGNERRLAAGPGPRGQLAT